MSDETTPDNSPAFASGERPVSRSPAYYDEAPEWPGSAGDHERQVLIDRIDELSPEDRRYVAALVESLWNRDPPKPADR